MHPAHRCKRQRAGLQGFCLNLSAGCLDGILSRLHAAVTTRVVSDRPKARPSSCLKGHQESPFQAGPCTPSRSVSGEGGGSDHAILDEKKQNEK